MKKIRVPKLRCKQCEHEWVPRKGTVYQCPACQSPRWNEPKQKSA